MIPINTVRSALRTVLGREASVSGDCHWISTAELVVGGEKARMAQVLIVLTACTLQITLYGYQILLSTS